MKFIEMYKFVMGTEEWTYTSGNESITYNSDTYTPVPLGRGNSETRNELSKATLEVKIDVLDALAQRLLTVFTEKVLTLTLYVQDQETATTSIGWKGRLSNIKPVKNRLTLSFESVFTSLRRPGLRARYQKVCRHVLYNRGCSLDPESFATVGQCSAVVSNIVTVPEAAGEANGYFTGGMIRAPDDLLAFIIDHTGSTLTLQRPFDSLWGGVAVTIYPGCNRLRQTCLDKFSNLDNFGGFPWIPSRNPMDGSSIV